MRWRFDNTGFHSGAFNMEYDEALARAFANGSGAPTVRVYGWEPATISLGWSQSFDEIDLKKAALESVDVVRRPTGGRAILHSDEVTYSVVMRSRGKRILAVYEDVSLALVQGLRKLGVDARLEKCQPHFPTEYAKPSSAACFTSLARYEVKIRDKKIVGSAQRRYSLGDGDEIVMQHGSILLGPDHRRLVDFLNLGDEEKIRASEELKKKTTDLSSELRTRVEFEDVVDAVKHGFEEAWNISFESLTPTHLTSQTDHVEAL